jgi:acyl-CoA reductase-like NAD-dependent aldehyde dehydrogenase
MAIQTKLLIGGEFVDALDRRQMDVINPFDGTVLASVSEAGVADVDLAVDAAQAAFPAWRSLNAAQRGRLLGKLADAIEDNAEELARLESQDTGHPIRDTLALDVPRTAATFRYFAGMADKFQGSVVPVDAGFFNYVLREPIGVVGQIVPWNFPLMFTSWKLGPALAAGNTVVMKPAEITPLSTLKIGELITKVGFPPGVVNLVPGPGPTTGQRLAEHPRVNKISFTGSTAVGRRIVQASAGNLKRVQLELGGKGANIVFSDANLPAAINGSAFAIFHNQGQACIAGSRLLLQESIADEFLDGFLHLAASIRLGDPLDVRTEMGPLTSERQQQSVLGYCDVAREQGAKFLLGGSRPAGSEFAHGFFVEPTVVQSQPQDRVNHEEVFGPFMSVSTFRDEDEAVSIANSTEYGLGGGLWTASLQRAHRVAGAMRSGMVWINCYKRVNPGSPFGGVGSSGYGREMGFEAMHDYTEAKSVWVNVDAHMPAHYQRS